MAEYNLNQITNEVAHEIIGCVGEEGSFFQDPLGFMEEHCYNFEEKDKLIKGFISTYNITDTDPNGHQKTSEFFDMIERDVWEYLISVCNKDSETFSNLDEAEQEEILGTICDTMVKKIEEQLINIEEHYCEYITDEEER